MLVALSAREILDSRGRPTVKATCRLASGAVGTASVPSGASTGSAEALELRDGDPSRYRGLGCRKAVAIVNEIFAPILVGREWDQASLDAAMPKLAANATLAVSLAFARATAPLTGDSKHLPRPMINLFSGGKHAGGQVPIQDVLVIPHASTIDECLATTFDVYEDAAELVFRKYGMRRLTADEGGLAPAFPSIDAMLSDAVEAIGNRPLSLAVDVAASHFYDGTRYTPGTSDEMIDIIAGWCERYPIISVEDGLAEDDWEHWPRLRERLARRVQVLGDDLLCTNPQRIRRAIDTRACDALLLKVNQIGTLTEAAASLRLAREAGWRVTVSARSGETED
ncbi:MAG TPA: enolase C-terminal domain-like protein, partial [Bryobacteraceae bacterium]|nr:enolase C-terminal domain-like protein [Bryobacteraceae bacterium]